MQLINKIHLLLKLSFILLVISIAQSSIVKADEAYNSRKAFYEIDACYSAMQNAYTKALIPTSECKCTEKKKSDWTCFVEGVKDKRTYTDRSNDGVSHAFDKNSKLAACAELKKEASESRWFKSVGECKCGKRSNDYFCFLKHIARDRKKSSKPGSVSER